MKEQLINAARKTRRAVSTANRVVTKDGLPVTLATCAGTAGGFIASGNPQLENVVGVPLGITLACVAKSFVDRSERDETMLRRGFHAGLRMGELVFGPDEMPGTVVFARPTPTDGEPLYTSLDGSRTITEPSELVNAIGDPEDAATRIGVRLHRIEQGASVTEDQVEYFRLVQAGLQMMPVMREVLCEAGQEMVNKMDSVVAEYEREHRPPQDQTPESS